MERVRQYCGVAQAAEILGDRWALVIVRDLLLGPQRYSDLLDSAAGISSNGLAARLRHLEDRGVVQRVVLPRPARGMAYQLTDFGRELEPVVVALGHWGARTLGPREPDQVIRPVLSALTVRDRLRGTPLLTGPLTIELRIEDAAYTVRADGPATTVSRGAAVDPELVVDVDVAAFFDLAGGELSPHRALADGAVRATGDHELAVRFLEALGNAPQQLT